MRATGDVSVVIPAYNAERFIAAAIDSCLEQSDPPREIIVVDDGSADRTFEIAAAYGRSVRAIRQPNRGEGGARNRGIDEACGAWIAFLDADDIWLPQKLERQLAICHTRDIVACHTNFRNFGAHAEVFDGSSIKPEERYSSVHVALEAPILPSSLLVRAELPVRFSEWANAAVDVIYCLELVRLGRVVLCPEPLVAYRRHEASMSADFRFALRVQRCLTRWLEENRSRILPAESTAIQAGLLERLVALATKARWQRRWEAVDEVRSFLEAYSAEPVVAQYLAQTRWPRWIYAFKDAMLSSVAPRVPRGAFEWQGVGK